MTSKRGKRPKEFKSSSEIVDSEICPFCPGNEKMTPPANHIYSGTKGFILKRTETNGKRIKNWLVRCIPNQFPALNTRTPVLLSEDELHKRKDGVGAHEVIIESPKHNDRPDKATIDQLQLVVQTYIDRTKALQQWEYVSIFRNHKRDGGASLSHAHSQLIALPIVPKLVSDELIESEAFYRKKGVCPFCEIIESEKNSPRFIYENNSFIAFSPWASIYPFEFWILPKRHQHSLLQIEEKEKHDLSRTIKTCLGGLSDILNDPPYTYGFHTSPSHGRYGFFHWHIEVYPKLTIQAGFENSTGMYINTTSPEKAAEHMRKSVRKIL